MSSTSRRNTTKSSITKEFSSFAAVGIIGTIAHYGVMAIFIEVIHMSVIVSSAIGFVSSAVLSYALNYRFTFSSSADHRSALPKFLAIGTIGLGINTVIVGIMAGPIGLFWLIAQAIATVVVLCWNFAANRQWTFS